MPFKSASQRAYLYANEPAVAAEFQRHMPKDAKLPEKLAAAKRKVKKKAS